ncbi:fructosamine kinase family protein [Ewingella americana]|uniref:Fructosamine kinase family protein n=1 Tax=Ewingella americana TaxID=41202 RepID=A0A502GLG7_9GAMM|nr:fructosamine kinase family protein [Ewingella americana]TPG62671.1 fructosamine kinase family protein [Ewingella americana]
MWQAVNRLLSEHLGNAEIRERVELPGGEIHPAWRLSYGDRDVFVKCNSREMLPIFSAEADQLSLLAHSQTVRVPEVYGVGSDRDYSFLLLEYLPLEPLDADSAYLLGQQLSDLHQWSEQLQFGLDFDNELATLPQPNTWQRRWATFFAEQRIGWQLQLAAEKNMIFGNIDDITAMVEARLHNHQPRPSLLHGDLWPHNCGLAPSGPVIFDPACYWGDRECDLAMLPLYPKVPANIYDGYHSRTPLPEDFALRQPVYQLYYLLNRSNLFGGQHLVVAQRAVERLLRSDDL